MSLREEEYESIEASNLSEAEKKQIYKEKNQAVKKKKMSLEEFEDFIGELEGETIAHDELWGDF